MLLVQKLHGVFKCYQAYKSCCYIVNIKNKIMGLVNSVFTVVARQHSININPSIHPSILVFLTIQFNYTFFFPFQMVNLNPVCLYPFQYHNSNSGIKLEFERHSHFSSEWQSTLCIFLIYFTIFVFHIFM